MKNNFKIIAIRPLKYCNHNYLKILEKDVLYYFYNDYEISKDVENEKIINHQKVIENLFNIKRKNQDDLNINICAIVGKNGSGKSSIIELLFRAINNIACKYKNSNKIEKKNITANLINVKGIHVEFYIHTTEYYKIVVNYKKIAIYKFRNGILNHLPEDNLLLGDLFYTEAVNYSHYAYNTREFGPWLKELFHKNDSYQTPLVLNPMRTNGNININTENYLINQRLLVNLLREDKEHFLKFGDNLRASKLVFSLRDEKRKVIYFEKVRENKFVEKEIKLNNFYTKRNIIISVFLKEYCNVDDFDKEKIECKIYNLLSNYIIYKLISISVKYSDYDKYKLIFQIQERDPFNTSLFVKYLNDLKTDTSHIVFKLNQTVNYLLNLYFDREYFKYSELNSVNECSFGVLSGYINSIKKTGQNIIELLPPPVFSIVIMLEKINGESENFKEDEFIEFNKMSSGEKQLIHSVSSILYHLYNIDSVSDNKLQYKNINIVFEEIELYFHPEMQKSFLKYLLDSISYIEIKNIESINICFVTHSPFILSDIPSNNIMFLEVQNGIGVQKTNKRKTFGANIHDLLTDNFFMSDGFIGDFSKDKISKTIDWLNDELLKKINYEKFNAKEQNSIYMVDQKQLLFHKGIISLIDESIIKIKLSEMLAQLEPKEKKFHVDSLKEQIKYLQSQIEELK